MIMRILILLGICSALAFAQGNFDAATGVVSEFDLAGQATVGTLARWLFGFLPLVLFCVGVFGAMKYSKKQAEHDQDAMKVYIMAGIAGIVGAIVGILIDALIGAALMGDAQKGLEVLRKFWSEMLKV